MAAINYKLLNEDGTELLLETGDSILLENYFYDTILKDSKYAIITTPLPIEKSLQYAMIKSNKIEKGIVYEIKLWPRKALKYCIETTQSIQKGVKYNISRTFIGQLGLNDTTNRHTPTQVGTSDWTAIVAGDTHSLGISGGKLYAWGWNGNGQLGDGTKTNKHTPTKIGTSDWTAIAGGVYHSLGIKEAIPSSNFFLFFN